MFFILSMQYFQCRTDWFFFFFFFLEFVYQWFSDFRFFLVPCRVLGHLVYTSNMNSLWKSWCKISLSVALFDHQETKDDIWENCKVNIKVTYNTDSVMGEHPQTWAIYFTSFSNKHNGNLAWQTLICYIHHTGFMKKKCSQKIRSTTLSL